MPHPCGRSSRSSPKASPLHAASPEEPSRRSPPVSPRRKAIATRASLHCMAKSFKKSDQGGGIARRLRLHHDLTLGVDHTRSAEAVRQGCLTILNEGAIHTNTFGIVRLEERRCSQPSGPHGSCLQSARCLCALIVKVDAWQRAKGPQVCNAATISLRELPLDWAGLARGRS
jgi:hypothetical protein